MLPEERASATQAHQLTADIAGVTKQARPAPPPPARASPRGAFVNSGRADALAEQLLSVVASEEQCWSVQIEYLEQDLKATANKLNQLKSQETSLQKVMMRFQSVDLPTCHEAACGASSCR